MKRITAPILWALLSLAWGVHAQNFTGNNQPGNGSLFSFTLGAGVTNLSLSVSNSSTAYSYLFLKRGNGASAGTYDFVSRMNKTNNSVNLELPDLTPGTDYSLWVQTPTNSATHAFAVTLSTNRADARQATMPILKPMEFSTTGTLTGGGIQFFQVDVPTNLPGWRVVLTSTGTADPDLYIQRGALPSTTSYLSNKRSLNRSIDTLFLDSTEATNQTYFIAVLIPSGETGSANYTLATEIAGVVTLSWEPGTSPTPTAVYTNHSAIGGDYFFKITTQNALSGVWRTRLDVQGGTNSLYLRQTNLPSVSASDFSSTWPGPNGIALIQGGQYQTNQVWYAMVTVAAGAQWSVYSGNLFITPLASPANDPSGGTNTVIAPEGTNFYRVTINSNTLAWHLGVSGMTNNLYVRQGAVAHGFSTNYYQWQQSGQILLVPPYLRSSTEYYVTVTGTPGQALTLDSRQQPIVEMNLTDSKQVVATDYGYLTYHVTVPADQIGWQIDLSASSGDPALAVRQTAVANEYINTAYSDTTNVQFETITLVPPTLTDGSYYLTVYGQPPYTATLTCTPPPVVDVDYEFVRTNDLPLRQGWRIYRVLETTTASLGWDLLLTNFAPGTELAVRRSAMPGRWASRTNYLQGSASSATNYLEASSLSGFLQLPQLPRLKQDTWYIGVNNTNQPLGLFVLTGVEINPTNVPLASTFGGRHVAGQRPGWFEYFQVDVPANAMGIEFKLANVTSGDPRLVVCRDLLPVDLRTVLVNSNTWTPNTMTNWPAGAQIAYLSDWSGYTNNASGSNEMGRFFFAGMGNPLEPGTYYIGVVNGSGTNSLTYDLRARGLFPGDSITSLMFEDAIDEGPVAPHDSWWYQVEILSNTPSWKLRLNVTGDATLLLRQDGLPNYGATGNAPTSVPGAKLQKTGNEQYLLLPTAPASSILAGTYYIGVIGEGQNPAAPRAGSNTCSFTFESNGALEMPSLGTVDLLGITNLVSTQSQEGGEVLGFTFTVLSNTPVIEVRLRDRTAYPRMVMRSDSQLAKLPDTYGTSGGWTATWADDKIIRVPTPTAGVYSVLVQAAGVSGKYTNATYTIDVSAQQPQPLAFDNGLAAVTNQPSDGWSYFSITIPTNVVGWDLRLVNVTSGDPRLVICRDQIPYNMSTRTASGAVWGPFTNTTWPTGYQVAVDKDWTGYTTSAVGTNETGRYFTAGMGNPLEPGTYIVGITNGGAAGAVNLSYQVLSRGIGTNLAIPVVPIQFAGGNAIGAWMAPHDVAFYSVEVPSNSPSWQVRLDMDNGDALMAIRRGGLPNDGAGTNLVVTGPAGTKMQKVLNDQFALLPGQGSNTIPAGTYYLAVVSEGVSPTGTHIGSDTSDFSLTSIGCLPITPMGQIQSYSPDLVTNVMFQPGGSVRAYQFTVVPGTLAFSVRLDNRVGNPIMTLLHGTNLPRTLENYGRQGGWLEDYSSTNFIRLLNTTVGGTYTLMVQAASQTGTIPDASYTLRIYSLVDDTIPLDFDGGTMSIAGHLANEWLYFSVEVPAEALGWDLRLRDIKGGSPRLVVCYSGYPVDLTSRFQDGGVWPWGQATNWPIGAQAAPTIDWTGYKSETNGTDTTGTIFAAGMGGPVAPGTYIIGVSSALGTTAPMTYTIASRGIGDGFYIPVTPLGTGSMAVAATNLAPREAAYYSFEVPTNTPLWKLRMTNSIGEALLAVRSGVLPSVMALTNVLATATNGGGHKFQKPGAEYVMLGQPPNEEAVVPGTYYVAVVGEGRSPKPATGVIGTNSTDFALYSDLPYALVDLGSPGGTTGDLVVTNLLNSGETAAYSFTLLPGVSTLSVSLENVIGNPLLRLRSDTNVPLAAAPYGQDGGYKGMWESTNSISLPSPTPGVYTVTLLANGSGTNWPQLAGSLRIHAQGAIPPLAFDGGSASITNQTDLWRVYYVTVPTNALGWDLRLINVTNGSPRLVIRRDQPPTNYISSGVTYSATTWPSLTQLAPTNDWTLLDEANGTSSTGHVFQAGMGNPLQPGTYYVGVTNLDKTNATSYTLVSRGIGSGYSLPVNPLDFANGNLGQTLPAREGAWYSVIVPSNTPSWKVALNFSAGDGLLVAQRGCLPNIGAYLTNGLAATFGGKKMQQGGGENLLDLSPGTNVSILPGTYYLAVISEGANPSNSVGRIGTGSCSFVLSSQGVLVPQDLGGISTQDKFAQAFLQAGECKTYQFSTPYGALAAQVSFDEVSGYPIMTMARGFNPPAAPLRYGADGGAVTQWVSSSVITVPNPGQTNFSITVQASSSGRAGSTLTNAAYKLHVRTPIIPNVNFSSQFNNNGLSNITTGVLQDGQKTYFCVQVPDTVNGRPVIGWKLSLDANNGTPRMRVRPDRLPEDGAPLTSTNFLRHAVFVPDYLRPGNWYIEVSAVGLTTFTLTSENLELERPPWQMPLPGQLVTTPGLIPTNSTFGDTGVATNGVPLPDDQGLDLEQDSFHYYAVTVPAGNVGLLRTELQAISRNPELYLRTNAPPTLSHNAVGAGGPLYDRALTNSGSQCGNWVVLDGKSETCLTPGLWYLAVHAAGGSNVRYRLLVSTGQISDVAFVGGGITNQPLNAGDWWYCRVQLPVDMPTNWTLSYTRQLGDVAVYLRDTVPPGQGVSTTDYIDWKDDGKNHGPYPYFTNAGAYTLTVPAVRPGNVYYIGVRALSQVTFSMSSVAGTGLIPLDGILPFNGGNITHQLPPWGVMRYRIDVPNQAQAWSFSTTLGTGVRLYLDQGTLPTVTAADHWSSSTANASWSRTLTNSSWPWLPGYMYYLAVTNTTATAQSFAFYTDGTGVNPPPAFTGTSVSPDGGNLIFAVTGTAGTTYHVLVSSNLADGNWLVYTNFVQTSPTQTITLPIEANYAKRFYRIVTP
jgi:hypothetical protein